LIKKYTKTAIFWSQNCKFSWAGDPHSLRRLGASPPNPRVGFSKLFLLWLYLRNSCVYATVWNAHTIKINKVFIGEDQTLLLYQCRNWLTAVHSYIGWRLTKKNY